MKMMLPERFGFKKNVIQFIYKEKFGAIINLNLVQEKRNRKFKKHNQLYF